MNEEGGSSLDYKTATINQVIILITSLCQEGVK